MNDTPWILLDTETTGLAAPIYVVELAAQRMRGWEPEGEPFRRLVNQNAEIPPEASRVHGYTREILERDGEPALQVYRDFARYAGGLPLVAFNLSYDLEDVLQPEWKRLGVSPIGTEGFCALRLAQRLLDPVPAGNCKLQTLRQFYRLPERGAHTALGDVQTVADLLGQVLRPLAEHRGLVTWDQVVGYTREEWYPSRISFGKHKGRLFQEARRDAELLAWLKWLAGSSNARSAKMGRWYLQQVQAERRASAEPTLFAARERQGDSRRPENGGRSATVSVIIYSNPELELLRQLVAGARSRLAELEVEHARTRARVDAMAARLFHLLRAHYQKRDRLRLIVDYRRQYLESLLRGGEEEAKQTEQTYEQARAQSDREYEEAEAAVGQRAELTPEEEAELGRLWRKLVKMYHPDRFAHEPGKLDTYVKLTSAINRAKDEGDIATLREIADDPEGFLRRQGWGSLDFRDEAELAELRCLHETLQMEIMSVLEALNRLKESPDYELCDLVERRAGFLDEIAAKRRELLDKETADLEGKASRLAEEIEELDGQGLSKIV